MIYIYSKDNLYTNEIVPDLYKILREDILKLASIWNIFGGI